MIGRRTFLLRAAGAVAGLAVAPAEWRARFARLRDSGIEGLLVGGAAEPAGVGS